MGAAFLVMVAALLASGLVSVLVVARIQSQVAELARLDEVVGLARTLDYSIVAQEHFGSMFVLTGEAPYLDKLTAEQQRFRETVPGLRAHPVGASVVGAVDDTFARYVEASATVIVAKRAGRDREAVDSHVAREHVIAHGIEALTKGLVGRLQAERRNTLDAILREQRLITAIVVGLVVGSLVLAVLLSILLAQSIVQPIREVDAALERIAHGESAGVAHDFNNLLASVLGQAELLLHELDDRLTPSETDRRVRLIQQAALDGAETVRRLFEFTRATPDGGEQQPLDVRDVVRAVLAVAEPRWKDEAHAHGRHIEVVTRIDHIPPTLGHVADLREVLLNLVFNAIDAMPDGGRLTVGGARVDDAIRISVSDTGVGMAPDVAARVFEPFFTTKGLHRSGLGLSMAYGIVQRHGGSIAVTSAPGAGSTFTVTLPFRAPTTPPLATMAAASNGNGLRVLVVDDEEMVRDTLRAICASGGHQVLAAASGREAIDVLSQHPVDLVVTDLGMPGMTGWQLADYVAEKHPHVKVALVTGWSARVAPDLLQAHRVSALIAKPFRRADVLAIIAGFAPRRGI